MSAGLMLSFPGFPVISYWSIVECSDREKRTLNLFQIISTAKNFPSSGGWGIEVRFQMPLFLTTGLLPSISYLFYYESIRRKTYVEKLLEDRRAVLALLQIHFY